MGKRFRIQSQVWLVAGLISTWILGCKDSSISLNPPTSQSYTVEREPVLGANGRYVYMISADTVHTERSGLFRADAGLPIREKLTIAKTPDPRKAHSLTVAPSGTRIAYLESDSFYTCNLPSPGACAAYAADSITAVAFWDDTLLVAERNDSLFSMQIDGSSLTFLTMGSEPRLENGGRIIYSQSGAAKWNVLLLDRTLHIDTVVTLTTQPYWPDLDTTGHWLACTSLSAEGNTVTVYDLVHGSSTAVAHSRLPRTCIVSQDLIVFTGENGQLYHTNYRGTTPIPWIYVKDQ